MRGMLPHRCSRCGKRFHLRVALERHTCKGKRGRFDCPHCKRDFTWEYQLKNHLGKRALTGECTKEPKVRANERKPCPYCGKKLKPAGLGAHLKRRKVIGECPKRKKRSYKPKPKQTDRIDNWTLEDCELIT